MFGFLNRPYSFLLLDGDSDGSTGGTDGDTGTDGKTDDNAAPPKDTDKDADADLKKLRHENASRRVKQRELEDRLNATQAKLDSVLTAIGVNKDAGGKDADATEKISQLQEQNKSLRLEKEVAQIQGVQPGASELIVQQIARSVVYDDKTGRFEGVAEAVEALRDTKPFLFAATDQDGKNANTTNATNATGKKTLGQATGGGNNATATTESEVQRAAAISCGFNPDDPAEMDRFNKTVWKAKKRDFLKDM